MTRVQVAMANAKEETGIAKRRRVSKKNKKNWRRHADVKDVEDYLEGRRREELFGVPAFEKSADDLFFVEKDISQVTSLNGVKRLTRRDLRQKPLNSEINLRPNTVIKGFPRQKRKTEAKKCMDISTVGADSSSDEELDTSASYRDIKDRYNGKLLARKKQCPNKTSIRVSSKDLWSEGPEIPTVNDEHYLKVTRKKKIKKPGSLMEAPSLLKSVELPHPGMSYNPTFQDHQSLLRKALVVEEKKLKASQKLNRRLQLTKMTHDEREKVWMEEMSEGILGGQEEGPGTNEVSVEEGGVAVEGGGAVAKRPVRAEERKTRKQRRKEILRKKEEMVKKLAKAGKMKMEDVYRLRSIKKEIAQSEAAASKKRAQTLELQQQAPYLTKRLGRLLFEEASIPLQLSSEVSGSLRGLKPEGSIAMERFKSLQKRNIIEPREYVRPHRKYKLLIKEKRSAKIEEDKKFEL